MSKENLIPLNERTEAERKVLAQKAGKASGEARRRKRDLKNTLDILLSKPFNIKGKSYKSLVTKIKNLGIEENEIDNQTAMAFALFLASLNGGKNAVSAFNTIRDTLGEKPKENVEITGQLAYEEAIKKVSDKDEY